MRTDQKSNLNPSAAGKAAAGSRQFRPKYQAIQLQQIIMREANNTETPASVIAQLARAWTDLEECKRKLSMKPLPGSLRPSSPQKQKRTAKAQPEEPKTTDKESPLPTDGSGRDRGEMGQPSGAAGGMTASPSVQPSPSLPSPTKTDLMG